MTIHTRESLAKSGIDSVTITPRRPDWDTECPTKNEYVVYGHGEYEDSSVLHGQYRRVFLDSFTSLETDKAAYPWAEVQGGLLPTSHIAGNVPSCPPADFDPLDAGESWDED